MTSPVNTDGAAPAAPTPKPHHAFVIVAVLMLIEAAGVFEQTMVLGGLPYFAKLFEIDFAAVAWMVTLFVLVGAGSAIVAGKLGDMYGRRRIVLILLAISLAGSLVTIIFGNFPGILVGRALQGTSAGIMPLLIGMAREVLPKERVPVAVALLTATATITAGVGMYVAGLFIDAGAWHYMFVVAAVLCLVAILLTWLVVPRSSATQAGNIDWFGAALMAPALIGLLYGFSTAQKKGLTDSVVIGSIGVGAVLLAVWIWWELRTPTPLVDLRLLFNPKMGKAMLVICLAGLAPLSVPTLSGPLLGLSPTGLPIGIGLTATTYGQIALFTSIVTFIFTPLAGRIAARNGAAMAMITGILLLLTAFTLLLVPAVNSSVVAFCMVNVLISIGNAFVISSVFNLIVENVPPESTSEYASVAQVARNVAMAIGTVAASALLSSSVVPGTTAPTASAWNLTMIYAIVISIAVIGVATALILQRRRNRTTEQSGVTDEQESAGVPS